MVSKQHTSIGHGRVRAKYNGIVPQTSNNDSPDQKKAIEKHIYKSSEKLNYTKLYEQFTKLMN